MTKDEMVQTDLYTSDYNYLVENEIKVGTAIRYALSEYVAMMKARAPGPGWHSLDGPGKETLIEESVKAPASISLKVHASPRVTPVGISNSPPPDLSTWTKQERNAWILEGVIPVRFKGMLPRKVIHDF
jgi:hypothetical protein